MGGFQAYRHADGDSNCHTHAYRHASSQPHCYSYVYSDTYPYSLAHTHTHRHAGAHAGLCRARHLLRTHRGQVD